jgi:site-specific DNA recombinase
MADLLAEAAAPLPRFAAVICEDIERSARDTFNALKLEKKLSRQGIPLFATDEPASIEGINATTVLVRRVKQGVAEWYRLQLKEKAWKGLEEHALAGWNSGPAPYGYAAERVPDPAPGKAAQGMTKSRLVPDPVRGPVVTQIFGWRVNLKLSVPAITARLNADLAAYPALDERGWTKPTVVAILADPKYTGHMVYGRTRETPSSRKARPVPQDQWIWSPQPVHPPLVDRATWDQAQTIGGQRGNVRDLETPTRQPGRRYILRSRIRCRICQRRMCGIWRPSTTGSIHIYYTCPHDPANPRHVAAHPDHPHVSIREDTLVAALAGFFDQYVFGYDRAALLAAQLPATAAGHAEAQARQIAHLDAQLARIEAAERGLITELEAPADPADPATAAYRARIRARYAELYQERTTTEAELAALRATVPQGNDPTLLDELPTAVGLLADAPPRIKEALFAAFDIYALYSKDTNQVTIRAVLTEDTPGTIAALLNDPRTDDDTGHQPAPPASQTPAQDTVSQLGRGTPVHLIHRGARIHRGNRRTPPPGVAVAVSCGGCDGQGRGRGDHAHRDLDGQPAGRPDRGTQLARSPLPGLRATRPAGHASRPLPAERSHVVDVASITRRRAGLAGRSEDLSKMALGAGVPLRREQSQVDLPRAFRTAHLG